MNRDLQAVIDSETHRQGAIRRTNGIWHQRQLATAQWDDWCLSEDDERHPLDAARQARDNNGVEIVPAKRSVLRPALLIRRRSRAGASVAEIAAEVGLPESVVRAVLDSPLTRALTLLEDADGD